MTTPTTGLLGIAQSGWKWNAAVVHKDLKSANISLKVGEDGKLTPVIADSDTWRQLPSEDHFFNGGHMNLSH